MPLVLSFCASNGTIKLTTNSSQGFVHSIGWHRFFDTLKSRNPKTLAKPVAPGAALEICRRAKRQALQDARTWNISMKLLRSLNAAVTRNLRTIEMIGVLMRIFSFSLVSWLGPASPFLFVWAFNTVDAIMLSWCAIIKKDKAYTVLNVFWIGVGIVGMVRAAGVSHP
ncbi:MAG: hypothetical protein WD065_06520 [Planctomycetaceae bacterium]